MIPVARSLRRWTIATLVTGALVRAVTCLGTWLVVGPLFGAASFPIAIGTGYLGFALEYLGGAIAVVAGVVAAATVTDGRYRSIRRVRVIGVIVIADTAFYLASVVIGVAFTDPSGFASGPLAVIVGTNLALVAAAGVILRRARAARREHERLAGGYVRKPRLAAPCRCCGRVGCARTGKGEGPARKRVPDAQCLSVSGWL